MHAGDFFFKWVQLSVLTRRDRFVDVEVDFGVEVADVDEVGNGEHGVVEQVVESTCEVQILGEFSIKAFVPVGRRTIHADEAVEGVRVMR